LRVNRINSGIDRSNAHWKYWGQEGGGGDRSPCEKSSSQRRHRRGVVLEKRSRRVDRYLSKSEKKKCRSIEAARSKGTGLSGRVHRGPHWSHRRGETNRRIWLHMEETNRWEDKTKPPRGGAKGQGCRASETLVSPKDGDEDEEERARVHRRKGGGKRRLRTQKDTTKERQPSLEGDRGQRNWCLQSGLHGKRRPPGEASRNA